MSLMHQALDRPATPGQASRSGYNPLRRNSPRSAMIWWVITLLALLTALAVVVWPRWRVANDLPVPAVMLPQSAEASQATPKTATTLVATTLTSEPEPQRTDPAPVSSVSAADRPEPNASPEHQPQRPPSLPSEPAESRRASPEPVSAAGSREQTRQVETEQPVVAVPQPVSEPNVSTAGEALPAPADTPVNAAEASVVTSRSASAPPTPDTRSGSSVATAVPQHDALRQAVQSAIGRGDLTQAQALLQSWIRREPGLEEPRIWLAKVYLNRGARAQAEALLVGLQSTEALGLRGLVLEQTERYPDAARIFEALTRKEASNPTWWLHWAINLENSGRLAEARLLYQTYLEQFSSHNARLTAFATERYRALAG